MASGSVYAVKLRITFAGQQCRPGFYVIEGAGNGDAFGPRGCADFVNAMLSGSTFNGFSAALTCFGTEVQDVQPGTERTYFAPLSTAIVGGIADDNPVPPQDSMLIQWTTDLKGGKGKLARRGRTYIPGIYSTGQVSGFLITDLQDALSAFASIFFDNFVTSGEAYQMHAVAFNPGTNPRTIAEVHPIAAFSVDNVVAIQRSRRPGKGI